MFLAQLFGVFPIFVEEKVALAAIEDYGWHSFHQGVPGRASLGQSGDEFF